MMEKWLLIFGLFISVAVVACVGAPDNVESDSSSGDAKLGGGSLHIDSFRATSGITGNTSARFKTTDTPKNTLASPYSADSLNKKKQ